MSEPKARPGARAMSNAIAAAADKFVHYHLSQTAEAELRSALAEAPAARHRTRRAPETRAWQPLPARVDYHRLRETV
jgi:hypothetical protein